jgi:hypothetical protein
MKIRAVHRLNKKSRPPPKKSLHDPPHFTDTSFSQSFPPQIPLSPFFQTFPITDSSLSITHSLSLSLDSQPMFLVSDERLRGYALPVQILMLGLALAACVWVFFNSFYEEFHKIVFTDEPRVPSDWAGFLLACANIFVIGITGYRFLVRVARQLSQSFQ